MKQNKKAYGKLYRNFINAIMRYGKQHGLLSVFRLNTAPLWLRAMKELQKCRKSKRRRRLTLKGLEKISKHGKRMRTVMVDGNRYYILQAKKK